MPATGFLEKEMETTEADKSGGIFSMLKTAGLKLEVDRSAGSNKWKADRDTATGSGTVTIRVRGAMGADPQIITEHATVRVYVEDRLNAGEPDAADLLADPKPLNIVSTTALKITSPHDHICVHVLGDDGSLVCGLRMPVAVIRSVSRAEETGLFRECATVFIALPLAAFPRCRLLLFSLPFVR